MLTKHDYNQMMDEIHVPPEVLGKVMEQTMEQKKITKKKLVKRACGIAAGLAVVFAASNGICYAATGATWLEGISFQVLSFDTEDGSLSAVISSTEDEGVYVYQIEGTGDTEEGCLPTIAYGKDDTIQQAQVKEIDGTLYLLLGGSGELGVFDITEDMEDGEACGTVECDGQTYGYTVRLENGVYTVGFAKQ